MVERETSSCTLLQRVLGVDFARIPQEPPAASGPIAHPLRSIGYDWQAIPPPCGSRTLNRFRDFFLLRLNQDLSMKIIFLDGKTRRAFLRRGMVPPNPLPPPNARAPTLSPTLSPAAAANYITHHASRFHASRTLLLFKKSFSWQTKNSCAATGEAVAARMNWASAATIAEGQEKLSGEILT